VISRRIAEESIPNLICTSSRVRAILVAVDL
jgi:hypothetical protein